MCAVGYDNLPVNFQQLLSAPLREATGVAAALTQDVARPHHVLALGGAGLAWGQIVLSNLTYLTLAATPDYIICADAVGAAGDCRDMNFGTAPATDTFTLAMWIYTTNLANPNTLVCYGEPSTVVPAGCGYRWYVAADGSIHFVTSQSGAGNEQDTLSAAAAVTVNIWWFLAVTCDGAYGVAPAVQANLYRNAVNVNLTQGSHIAPADCITTAPGAPYDFYIGTSFAAGATVAALSLVGNIWNPRVWERELPQIEIWELFEMERAFFGV